MHSTYTLLALYYRRIVMCSADDRTLWIDELIRWLHIGSGTEFHVDELEGTAATAELRV